MRIPPFLKGSESQRVFLSTLWLPFSAQVKPLIRMILEKMVRLIPEPTKETIYRKNGLVLLDLRDKFLENNKIEIREVHFRAVWNILILLYEDPIYCVAIDEAIGEFLKSDWDFNAPPPDPKEFI